MPDYREKVSQATTWRRAFRVEIHNPLPGMGVPFVEFREDDVTQLADGRTVTTPAPTASPLLKRFDPELGVFALRNPQTGALTGKTMTHGELYAILHSLYIHEALERDARDAAAAAAAAAASAAPAADPAAPAAPATPQQPS